MVADDESPMGYSLRRNDTCAVDESDCGLTWGSFHICCPGNTICPPSREIGICCPDTTNCIDDLDELCADPTADLYFSDQSDGFFCCENDTEGFNKDSGTHVGCAKTEDVHDFGADVKTMRAIIQSARPTSTSSIMSTSRANNANTDTSHSNTGAIAGGVVGGIAGVVILIALAWYLLRRRKKKAQDSQPIQRPPMPISELSDGTRITELSDGTQITELSGQSISELPGSEKQKLTPAELAS
ncbi:hypothetical protein N7536_001070 [Penicillium majusculum]|uniref:Mid2 domain-containing protein n=1 Tax=Penicillium solitum TaxID=60172 RepID=A0A1V6R6N5_9EURO|nr:uncharacterized protein PENSOL_c013G12073 [Penicillium solitum]KAJ5705381.1 hypothetical protein N7536_001070 [Penicillium majusculum]OQD97194.1 hypothetical protein PENSOL_c013G12073 [Penicillium solitum]